MQSFLLALALVLVLENQGKIEDEDEDEEEKFVNTNGARPGKFFPLALSGAKQNLTARAAIMVVAARSVTSHDY